jgi:hypothetical protein
MTFPAHQGLILPLARRWPNSFDALALSVGAAMPDITDTILSFPINGYFRQWYGHSLLGVFTLDLAGGLFITSLIAALATRFLTPRYLPQRFRPFLLKALSATDSTGADGPTFQPSRNRFNLRSFSVLVGILSHVGFDLISHDTNLLFYPWYENLHWFPKWWYTIWIELPRFHAYGRTYSVGFFSVIWVALTLIGTISFIQFIMQKPENKV